MPAKYPSVVDFAIKTKADTGHPQDTAGEHRMTDMKKSIEGHLDHAKACVTIMVGH